MQSIKIRFWVREDKFVEDDICFRTVKFSLTFKQKLELELRREPLLICT